MWQLPQASLRFKMPVIANVRCNKMARTWIEAYTANKHTNHMPEVCHNIEPHGQVIVIEEGKFRLEFLSLLQLEAAIEYFKNPNTGSTRLNSSGGDHWEFQQWHCKLPSSINNKHHRPKILQALKSAMNKYSNEGGYRDACT